MEYEATVSATFMKTISSVGWKPSNEKSEFELMHPSIVDPANLVTRLHEWLLPGSVALVP
jgi:hypothetical protein